MAYIIFASPVPTLTRTDTLAAAPLPSMTRTRTAERPLLRSFPQRYDWPIQAPTKAISGTVYAPGAIAVAGAIVKLIRQIDDYVVAQQAADISGHYVFLRDADDPYAYYTVGYAPSGTPQKHGTSDRDRVPA